MKIKHINLNIWMGKLLENAVEFLLKEAPDIVTLQEVYNETDAGLEARFRTLPILLSRLKFEHFAFAPCFLYVQPEGKFKIGNAVLSRFPIIRQEDIFFDIPYGEFLDGQNPEQAPKNLLHAGINISGHITNIFAVHGIWGTHGGDTERRARMINVILGKIGENKRAILAGDFNLNEKFYPLDRNGRPVIELGQKTEAVKKLETKLVNVFKDERISSFNMKYKTGDSGYGRAVVDMVFVTPDVKVLSHRNVIGDFTDHSAQVCEYEI